MSRRHNTLIPLSHQHQHALALCVLIRRRFGIEKGEPAWRDEMLAKIKKLYAGELSGHFEVEETVLFPEMERYLGQLELIAELRREHHTLRRLVASLGDEPKLSALEDFAALLNDHVRKEERQLFAEFEKNMPAQEAGKLGREIEARLIKACPRL